MREDEEFAQLTAWRQDLHRIPERAHQEQKTAAYLADAIRQLGWEPVRLAGTGLAVDVDGMLNGPRVLWRADIDALPLEEATGLPFRSQHPGLMHACGHDGHMAIALGLLARLAEEPPPRPVRVVFQPAEEEHPGGALGLIAAGVLEGVERVMGLHLWTPLTAGTAAIPGGPVSANSDRFLITIQGRGGHGSEPEAARDAVLAAAASVTALQTVVSRKVPPLRPAVLTCASVEAGQALNIIADRAIIRGTVRTTDEATRVLVEASMREVLEGVGVAHDVHIALTYTRGYPAVVNEDGVARAWRDALPDDIAEEAGEPGLIGEDFAYYLEERPGAFCLLGAMPTSGPWHPHHSPNFDFAESALLNGVHVALAAVRLDARPRPSGHDRHERRESG
jgi:amidohydrolase